MADIAPFATDAGVHMLYITHGGALHGYARRALGDDGLAEDAVQETFARAWKAGDHYDPERGTTRTWLFAILKNVIIDLAKARDRAAGAPVLVASDTDEIDRILLTWQVEAALISLRDEHRIALVEIYYKARAYADVASELGVPVGTVKSRVYYALKNLRLILEEQGWDGHA